MKSLHSPNPLLVAVLLLSILAVPSFRQAMEMASLSGGTLGSLASIPTSSPTPTQTSKPIPSFVSSPSPVPSIAPPPYRQLLTNDITPPSVPQNLSIADVWYTPSRYLLLVWEVSSTDNVGVAGYKIYRDGVLANQIGPSFMHSPYATTTLPAFIGTYVYTIRAYDAAGNESAPSNPITYISPGTGSRIKLIHDIKNSQGTVAIPRDAQGVIVWDFPFWYNSGIIHYAILFDNPLYNDDARLYSICTTSYGECPGEMFTIGLNYPSTSTVYTSYMLIADPYLSITPISPPDTMPPTAAITAPIANATVSGTTTVTVNATDNVGVASVQLLLNNQALGPLDFIAPYTYTWNTRSAQNGTNTLQTVVRDAAGNFTLTPPLQVRVSNGVLDPAKKPWQNFNLDTWKIQVTAKTPLPTDYFLKQVASNPSDAAAIAPWFSTDTSDGSMRLWLDATKTNDGTWYRTELREVMDTSTTNTNWSALVGTSTIKAAFKIKTAPTYNANQITLLQVHPLSGDPLVRLVWYGVASSGRNLKVHYKTDAAGLVNASVYCPNTNITLNTLFTGEILVINGRLTVKVDGQICLNNFAINPGWTHENYFKAGNYASQSWGGVGQVNIYSLDVTHSVPGI